MPLLQWHISFYTIQLYSALNIYNSLIYYSPTIMTESTYQTALRYCINLLSRRDYSEQELRNKMQSKKFCENDIDAVIEHCQQKKWQSDRRFCENFINLRIQRGYGEKRIIVELNQKGIKSHLYSEVFEDLEVDWFELAKELLHKKFPQYHNDAEIKLKQKVYRYMMSHGFNSDAISYAMNIEEY